MIRRRNPHTVSGTVKFSGGLVNIIRESESRTLSLPVEMLVTHLIGNRHFCDTHATDTVTRQLRRGETSLG